MNRSKKLILTGLLIAAGWIIIFSGILGLPIYAWLFMAFVTMIYYFFLTSGKSWMYRDKGSIEDIVNDMEDYMERRAEQTEIKELKKAESQDNTNDKNNDTEEKDEYDFGDDVEIIKK